MSSYPWAAGYIDYGDRPKLVTSRFEHEDSYTLERYHATGGYAGLRAALGRTPAEVHDEVRGATVLGRGGAGFPAGVKWGLMPAGKYPRYLVVNGDESEPGTYKDRLLMERDPHQLVEGCLIAAYAAVLSQVFLYIRGEMPLATSARTSWARTSASTSCCTGAPARTWWVRRRRSSRASRASAASHA